MATTAAGAAPAVARGRLPVLISGCGIGGLACALALSGLVLEVKVL
jgi:hypothetical protein